MIIYKMRCHWTIHVQYCGIMRFTVLHNRPHKVSRSVSFFMYCKTLTVLLRIRARGHFVMSIIRNRESHYVTVLDNPPLNTSNFKFGNGLSYSSTRCQGCRARSFWNDKASAFHSSKIGFGSTLWSKFWATDNFLLHKQDNDRLFQYLKHRSCISFLDNWTGIDFWSPKSLTPTNME